jgi:hypothetical protein
MGRDAAVDALTWRPGRLTGENTHLAVRALHRRTAGRSSRWGLSALRAVYGSEAPIPRLDGAWAERLQTLHRDGVVVVPSFLDGSAIARIRDFATTAPAVLRSVDGSIRRGTLADRDDSTAAVTLVERFVIDQPDIQSLIANASIWSLAAANFATTPVVHPPLLHWSIAGATVTDAERRRGARQYHWDYDGLAGMRVHLYLTDVDEGAAPMSYVVGSHRPGALSSRPLRNGDRGIPDDALRAAFPDSAVRVMTGPAGTMFVSDSHGLHSGSDAITADRLFLAMPVQATSFASYQLEPRAVTPRDPQFAEGLQAQRPELIVFRKRTPGPDLQPRH